MAAKRDASGRPSALEVTNALLKLSVEQTKELVFQLGVPLQDIDDVLHRGGVLVKARLVKKWLDIYASASWEQLVSALRRISMDSLAVEVERTYVPGNSLEIQTPIENSPVSSVALQAAHPPEPTSTQDMSSTPGNATQYHCLLCLITQCCVNLYRFRHCVSDDTRLHSTAASINQ